MILTPFKKLGEGWKQVAESIIRDSSKAVKGGRLCNFYIIWKPHKAANAFGLRSRPIAAAIDYVTGPASHFLHSQLKEAVWKHPRVLKDSMELIRIVRGLRFDVAEQIMLTSADVNALYPSIQLERGMTALRWFMDNQRESLALMKLSSKAGYLHEGLARDPFRDHASLYACAHDHRPLHTHAPTPTPSHNAHVTQRRWLQEPGLGRSQLRSCMRAGHPCRRLGIPRVE